MTSFRKFNQKAIEDIPQLSEEALRILRAFGSFPLSPTSDKHFIMTESANKFYQSITFDIENKVYNRYFLIGEPGSGKTTILNNFLMMTINSQHLFVVRISFNTYLKNILDDIERTITERIFSIMSKYRTHEAIVNKIIDLRMTQNQDLTLFILQKYFSDENIHLILIFDDLDALSRNTSSQVWFSIDYLNSFFNEKNTSLIFSLRPSLLIGIQN